MYRYNTTQCDIFQQYKLYQTVLEYIFVTFTILCTLFPMGQPKQIKSMLHHYIFFKEEHYGKARRKHVNFQKKYPNCKQSIGSFRLQLKCSLRRSFARSRAKLFRPYMIRFVSLILLTLPCVREFPYRLFHLTSSRLHKFHMEQAFRVFCCRDVYRIH